MGWALFTLRVFGLKTWVKAVGVMLAVVLFVGAVTLLQGCGGSPTVSDEKAEPLRPASCLHLGYSTCAGSCVWRVAPDELNEPRECTLVPVPSGCHDCSCVPLGPGDRCCEGDAGPYVSVYACG